MESARYNSNWRLPDTTPTWITTGSTPDRLPDSAVVSFAGAGLVETVVHREWILFRAIAISLASRVPGGIRNRIDQYGPIGVKGPSLATWHQPGTKEESVVRRCLA